MKTADIIKIPVTDIVDDNAHLYLWVTNNFMEDGFRVARAWGFRPVTIITWKKDRIGLGQYFRGITEHCIFGVRGNLPYKIIDGKRQQGTTYFEEPKKNHSKKPETMRRMIEKVSDREGYNKIEIFARVSTSGWDVWGNEVESDIDL